MLDKYIPEVRKNLASNYPWIAGKVPDFIDLGPSYSSIVSHIPLLCLYSIWVQSRLAESHCLMYHDGPNEMVVGVHVLRIIMVGRDHYFSWVLVLK